VLQPIVTTNNLISLNNITRVVLEMETPVTREVESEYMRELVMTVTLPKEEGNFFIKRIPTVLLQINQMRMQGEPLAFWYLDAGRLVKQNPSGRCCDRLTPSKILWFFLCPRANAE
jgi:hypothetical protein